jgi:hypothetical protein
MAAVDFFWRAFATALFLTIASAISSSIFNSAQLWAFAGLAGTASIILFVISGVLTIWQKF